VAVADRIVAENGTVVEAGGIYLTYSGDPDTPYKFVKVVSIGGTGASIGVQVGPNLGVIPSQDLWAKIYYASSVERPVATASPAGEFRVLPISVAMFLAWGPPTFPIRVGTEPVTPEELSARAEEWNKYTIPDCASDSGA
jgi:hypothetical protein